ncbi:MAG TPA: LacI family DNA-binding transcriptional regulator [Streptomyces sp.]|nr:LacI family DNA-binding transcriptional regulator [Streptomyces sp.]
MAESHAAPRRRQPVTMKAVAEHAGVHVSTVSRALSESAAGVSPEVVARIREIARELGYQPNAAAASLRTRRTRGVGVVVPRLTDAVLATIFEGIDSHATDNGYQAVVASTGDNPDERCRRLRLLGRRIDGLIVGDAHLSDDSLAAIADSGMPFVLVNRRAAGRVSVTCADERGGRLVGRHFLDLGHRRIGIAGGHPWASTAMDRADGCRAELAEHGVRIPDPYVLHYGFDVDCGRRAGEALLDLDPRPTAIFAVNDYSALGVMAAMRDRGLVPGRDIAVAGFNDTDIARQLTIPLTSVDSSPHRMGQIAAETLLHLLAGKEATSVELAPVLRVRASTTGGTGAGGREQG